MDELLAGLQASGYAQTMRTSVFLYPLANVVHLLAALAFFAAVAAMDVKVLRAGAVDEARAFIRRVRPAAAVALVFQVGSGVALLAPEALHIWHNPLFRIKLLLVALGLINVIVIEVILARRGAAVLPPAARGSAAASLALWLGVAATGRLIAYF